MAMEVWHNNRISSWQLMYTCNSNQNIPEWFEIASVSLFYFST